MYITAIKQGNKSCQNFGMAPSKSPVKAIVKLSDDIFLKGLPEITDTQSSTNAKRLINRIAQFKDPKTIFEKLFSENKHFDINSKKSFSKFATFADYVDSNQTFFKSFYANGELPKEHFSTFLNYLPQDKKSLNEFITFIETKKPDLRISQTQGDFIKLAKTNPRFRTHLLENTELYFPAKEPKTIEFKHWKLQNTSPDKSIETIESLKELSNKEIESTLNYLDKNFVIGYHPANNDKHCISAIDANGNYSRFKNDGIYLTDEYKKFLDNLFEKAEDYKEPKIINKIIDKFEINKNTNITNETAKYIAVKKLCNKPEQFKNFYYQLKYEHDKLVKSLINTNSAEFQEYISLYSPKYILGIMKGHIARECYDEKSLEQSLAWMH